MPTKPKTKRVKAWMFEGYFNRSTRNTTHLAKTKGMGWSDEFHEISICFKKPSNPAFVQVEITYTLPATKKK